ncbi:hypothetical protein [Mucilaginibacter sp. FT3.2]|uniref:hypothetical protein n=1 Tax=Mucilaginibacter sp. FT3.2 TaxID=2723090 RepID=UPI00161F2522|nr:hypothetical protein [Mucilaginibacter sp. FT3.2]MBB6234263.1 hypothetical protein [Mucilaginibacter sp. FT3.2]
MGKHGRSRQRSIKDGLIMLAAQYKLIPTATAMDSSQATAKMNPSHIKKDSLHSMTLTRLIAMLPTPTARDWKAPQAIEHKNAEAISLPGTIRFRIGMNGQLNPRFVAEMMGFPPDWTELPFQNGEAKVSKPSETP